MPVTFNIPGALREFTGGRSRVQIEISGGNVGDALAALWTLYPGIRDRVATEQGQIRQHINVFVGDENVRYTGGLATPITEESEVSIVPAVSGGMTCLDGNRRDPNLDAHTSLGLEATGRSPRLDRASFVLTADHSLSPQ